MHEKNRKHLLPGEDIVRQGLADLARERETDASLLVLIAAPRLKRLGLRIPSLTSTIPWEHRLYARLDRRLGPAAHSYYNSLIRLMVSYARALELRKKKE